MVVMGGTVMVVGATFTCRTAALRCAPRPCRARAERGRHDHSHMVHTQTHRSLRRVGSIRSRDSQHVLKAAARVRMAGEWHDDHGDSDEEEENCLTKCIKDSFFSIEKAQEYEYFLNE